MALPTVREQMIASICREQFWRHMASKRRTHLDRECANALLVSCLFNRQIGWTQAMGIVPELQRRSGIIDTLQLFTELDDIMLEWLMFDYDGEEVGSDARTKDGRPRSLHRYRYMPRLARSAMLTIRDEYQGDARNIFHDPRSPDGTITGADALHRVLAIKGLGTKTGSLFIRVAVCNHTIQLWGGYQGVQPADDRWVKRVGHQLGLWREDADFKTICEVAGRLSFCAPVEVDALFLASDWACGTERQSCKDNGLGESCPWLRACTSATNPSIG